MRKTSEATGSQSENLLWKELKVGGFLKSAFFNVEAAENFNFLSFVSSLIAVFTRQDGTRLPRISSQLTK